MSKISKSSDRLDIYKIFPDKIKISRLNSISGNNIRWKSNSGLNSLGQTYKP